MVETFGLQGVCLACRRRRDKEKIRSKGQNSSLSIFVPPPTRAPDSGGFEDERGGKESRQTNMIMKRDSLSLQFRRCCCETRRIDQNACRTMLIGERAIAGIETKVSQEEVLAKGRWRVSESALDEKGSQPEPGIGGEVHRWL